MANPTIKHFIFIRIFPEQGAHYPYNVLDVDFLAGQLELAKNNALRSLENQTCKNAEIIFVMHDKHFLDKKYEFLFSTLKESTTFSCRFIKNLPPYKKDVSMAEVYAESEWGRLAKQAAEEYDFVIHSRLDLDDFIRKDVIEDTQNKVNECENILAYGYCQGYKYVEGDLYEMCYGYKQNSHTSLMESIILNSEFARSMPFISIMGNGLGHWRMKEKLTRFLESNGIKFSENMFQQNISYNAYVYFQCRFSWWHHIENKGNTSADFLIPKEATLVTEGITKKQLEEEFGFTGYELKSIE